VFTFDLFVSDVSFTVYDAAYAMEAHGFVDTPGAVEDEERTVLPSGESACVSQKLSFDSPVNRATIVGSNDDADLTWGVDDVNITWSCE
jgi:hypothetical protein